MNARNAFLKIMPFAILASMSPAAWGQTTTPETTPDLRDFRLEPQKPAPTPVTGPQSSEPTSPPPTSTQPSKPAPSATQPVIIPPDVQPEQLTREPVRPTAQPRAETERQSGSSSASAAVQSVDPAADTATDVAPDTVASPRSTGIPIVQDTAAPDSAPSIPIWPILAAIAALLAAAGAWLWARSRRAKPDQTYVDPQESAPPALEPAQAEIMQPAAPPTALPVPSPDPVVAVKPKRQKAVKATDASKPRALLDLEFVPDRAVVSMNNLTVSGRMRLINRGDVPARKPQLRIALSSASAQQANMISSFHADAENFSAKGLDDVDPGTQVDMNVELGIALSELQSFSVNGQQLFVPMLLANIGYDWDGRDDGDAIEFACLIGKEATPPQPKMGPLRLDLGPRSFAGLGQRPLAA